MKNEVENNFFREKPKLLVQLKSATTFGAISSSPIILDWNHFRSGTFPLTFHSEFIVLVIWYVNNKSEIPFGACPHGSF